MWALLCAFLISVSASQDQVVKDSFNTFVNQYQKEFSPEEYAYRLGVFANNLKIASALDEASQQTGPNPARFGITQFMDLTPEEFKEFYLMSNVTQPTGPTLNFTINRRRIRENIAAKDQDNIFDWKSKGKTTPVYNQGQCGSCWAFSVTEQLESMWAIAGHPLTSLSMQQLVDCDHGCSHGCAGGEPVCAWRYLHANGGQDKYSSYPYNGRDGTCRANKQIGAKFHEWGYVTQTRNEEVMKNYLLGTGPISVCVDAHEWQYYKNGIVRNCGKSIDHCVQITGWDFSYNAWVVRNSWGPHWGQQGYIAVASGGDVCAIAQLPTSVKI